MIPQIQSSNPSLLLQTILHPLQDTATSPKSMAATAMGATIAAIETGLFEDAPDDADVTLEVAPDEDELGEITEKAVDVAEDVLLLDTADTEEEGVEEGPEVVKLEMIPPGEIVEELDTELPELVPSSYLM